MKEEMDSVEGGVLVVGFSLQSERYPDDQALVDRTQEGLEQMFSSPSDTCERNGMKLNVEKAKVMKISKMKSNIHISFIHISVNGSDLEQVPKCKYFERFAL